MNINDWYMMQRKRQQELRKRRQEAEQMLHGFRGYYDLEWMGSPRAKSRGSGGGGARHLSYENPMDDHLPDPDQHIRHQSAIPQFGSNDSTGSDEYGNFLSSPPNRLHPNRMSFLSEHQHYDGTHYPRTEQDMEVSKGVRLFNDETAIDHVQGFPGKTPYTRRYVGMGIDTTESVERLRKAKSTEGNGWDNSFANNFGEDARTNLSENRFMPIREQAENRESSGTNIRDGDDASMDRDGPPQVRTQDSVDDAEPVPITIWRDFISDEPDAKFKPEAGRYHLYASYACPGSHRALIVRALKGLEDVVSVTIVHPTWRHTNCNDPHDKHRGWVFGNPGGEPFQNTMGRGGPFPPAYKGNDPDPILNAYSVRDLYEYAKDTSGRYTIPLLWDKKLQTIVNNESSDISYMLNSSFNDFAKDPELDLYTEDDEDGLDRLNEVSQWLYPMMIHGVYRCGFAKTQRAYDQAIQELTDAFDAADDLLQRQRYLTGDTLTDADIRLFVTLIRFDEVYAFYFRANTRLVMLTPSLLNFCREIYQMPGVAETCQMEQIKAHFFGSHAEWNKYSVVPRGLGFMKHLEVPHNRDEICREDAPTQESI
jgi:putative glutathione S-transferase